MRLSKVPASFFKQLGFTTKKKGISWMKKQNLSGYAFKTLDGLKEKVYDTILCEIMSGDDKSPYMYNPEKALARIEAENRTPPPPAALRRSRRATKGKSAKRLSY